jgi:hypothetical protein
MALVYCFNELIILNCLLYRTESWNCTSFHFGFASLAIIFNNKLVNVKLK